jgi:chromosome segregation ATPase
MKRLTDVQLQQQIIHYKSELEKYKHKVLELDDDYLSQKIKSLHREIQELNQKVLDQNHQIKEYQYKLNEETTFTEKYFNNLKAQQLEIKKLNLTLNQYKDKLLKSNQIQEINLAQQASERSRAKSIEDQLSCVKNDAVTSQMEQCYLIKENQNQFEEIQSLKLQLYQSQVDLYEMELKRIEKDTQKKIEEMDELKQFQKDQKDLIETLTIKESEKVKQLHKAQKLIHSLQGNIQILNQEKHEIVMGLKKFKKEINLMKEDRILFEKKNQDETKQESVDNQEQKDQTIIQHLLYTNAILMEEIQKLKQNPN